MAEIKKPTFPKPAAFGYNASGMSCYHYTAEQVRKYAADRVRYELARQAKKEQRHG